MTDARGVTGQTRVVGVWGHPVAHSRSPAMQNAALVALGLDWVYVPFDVDPGRVQTAVDGIRALGIVGVNVTIPLKELVLPCLEEIDEDAQRIGSVNTIHNRDGRLHGSSTDGQGFLRALEAAGQTADGRSACLLGAGGSARAVAFALAARGAHVQIANRTQARAEALSVDINHVFPGAASVVGWGGEAAPFDLLVNTTSIGMSPRDAEMPSLPPLAFRHRPFVYDLIYSPAETRLLRAARDAGCAASNGVGMLVQQGALSLARWTGILPESLPLDVMTQAVLASLETASSGTSDGLLSV